MAEVLHADAQVIGRLDVPEHDALGDDIRELVDRHGNDNWIRALALNPDTARRFAQYFEGLFSATGGRLPIEERELIAVIVSRTNGCGLCTIHHAHALGAALDDRVKARRIALDYHLADLSPRQFALAQIAETITTTPREITAQDLDRLRALASPTPTFSKPSKRRRGSTIPIASSSRPASCRTKNTFPLLREGDLR
ncbi:hypothetical protein BTHE68_56280 [Burkholderia sp. THE68]|uniref:peroxidase-related enzyme n=1 Tax=Burkholderia sp. THE68 TaxID=758782 RepID=UPI0013168EDE|nr:peroxidase-related enzyme [Burkholderia sp. THE68]BBU31894.1 hypothetical protein BTHE68_56280 [Burkholderia sp. THE68]